MACTHRADLARLLASLTVALLLVAPDAQAARWRFQSSVDPGAYAVGHSVFDVIDPTRDDRTLPVDVWYPVDAENADGELSFYNFHLFLTGVHSDVSFDDADSTATIGFPLVVYSHGGGGISTEASTLMESLASHGFVAAAPSHVGGNSEGAGTPDDVMRRYRPLDVSLVIDRLLERNLDPLDPLYLRINPNRIGVAGYSFGGWTAMHMASGRSEPSAGPDVPPDPRVRAIAGVAPGTNIESTDEELTAIGVPLFLMGGTLDVNVTIDPYVTRPWALATGRPIYRADVAGATHGHFSWQCDFAESLIADLGVSEAGAAQLFKNFGGDFHAQCRSPLLSIPEAQRIRDFYLTAFFERHLLDDAGYDEFLTPAYAAQHEPGVSFQRKDVGQR
jgi:predicted dienelactone hydrolase